MMPATGTVPAEKRPSIVTVAGALLIVAAVLLAVRAVLALPYLTEVTDAARAAYANSTDPNVTGDNVATGVKLVIVGSAVILVIFAAGLVVFGVLDLRGNNVGRILTRSADHPADRGDHPAAAPGRQRVLPARQDWAGAASDGRAAVPDPAHVSRWYLRDIRDSRDGGAPGVRGR
jgi:hypothetical protein